jgi:ERCC4-type nuclease
MQLIIDNREPKEIVTLLQSRIDNVVLDNLNIGDFIIKNNNGDIVLIFERKSLSDLIASIKDGRYNEQSYRLSECEIENRNIYYIIEGNIMNFCNKNSETFQKMLFSSMLSLSYKKGFSLLHTSGSVETTEFIIRFYEKLKTEKITKKEKEDVKYSEVVKTAKKANITKDNINEIMLSSIPGISVIVANELMKQYKTISNLTNNLVENNNCLDNFKINFKNKERKIASIFKMLLYN